MAVIKYSFSGKGNGARRYGRRIGLKCFYSKLGAGVIFIFRKGNSFVFATGLFTHGMPAAAAVVFSLFPFYAFKLAAAIMQLKSNSRAGSPVQHDQRYDKNFFHL
jgi:hypothetical protein